MIFASSPMTLICSQIVPLAHLEVGEIVRRSDLHDAGSELRIDGRILDERKFPAHERQNHGIALELLVALVVRMDRNGAYPRASFRAGLLRLRRTRRRVPAFP